MPADDLERAQLKKLHLICQRARIRKGSRILEIGYVCSYGKAIFGPGLPFLHQVRVGKLCHPSKNSNCIITACITPFFQAAGTYGAIVDTLTISIEQKAATDENIKAAGLSDSITVHVLDYRKMPPSFHHVFDAVVSIGVMEHGRWIVLKLTPDR